MTFGCDVLVVTFVVTIGCDFCLVFVVTFGCDFWL